jgi:hypothetical protein
LWDTLKSPPELVAQASAIVGQGDQPPTVVDDVFTILPNQTAQLDVLANDDDPEQGVLTLVGVETPSVGRATIVGSKITYVPPSGFAGEVVLIYTVRDSAANERTGRVTVRVTGINYFPAISKR